MAAPKHTIYSPPDASQALRRRISLATTLAIFLCLVPLAIASLGWLGGSAALVFMLALVLAILPLSLAIASLIISVHTARQLAGSGLVISKLSDISRLSATQSICASEAALTTGQPLASRLRIGHTSYRVTGSGFQPTGKILTAGGRTLRKAEKAQLELFFAASVLTSRAHLLAPDARHDNWRVQGSPSEGALLALASKAGLDASTLAEASPELQTFADGSASKLQSSVRRYGRSQQRYVFVRGVSESVLARCDEIWDHGHIRRLSARDRQRISQELPEATQTIALAYRMLPAATKLKSLSKDQAESKLTWIGLVSLEDPVKPGVPAAMAAARRLRLRVNIVTSAQSQSANSLNPDGQAVAVADSHTDFPTLVAAILASRASVQNLKTAAFSCLTASAAVLIVVLASLATALAFQLPPALSVMQILAISLLAALPPATALAWEKSDPSRQPQHNHPRQLSLARASASIFWCGLLIGGLAFANYLWVFARNHVDPGGLGAASLIHQKATTLAFLTIVLCQLAVVLQYRSRQGLFTRYQLHNKKLWLALAFSLACTLAIIYVPFLSPFFGASSLGLTSWLSALAATVLFILIREFQRYEQQHHRHVVLKLHQASQQKPAS